MTAPFTGVTTSRSMGLKLIIVCVLALVMTIPALFVWSLIEDRSQRAGEVVKEVGGLVGGPQTFLGPVIAIPYVGPAHEIRQEKGVYVVFPATADAVVGIKTEVRHRSLFKVPVYRSDLQLIGSFDLSSTPGAADGVTLDWNHAEFVVGATDARGAQSEITINVRDKVESLGPAVTLQSATVHLPQGGDTQVNLFGVSAADLAQPDAKFQVTANLKFTGAQRIAVLPFGKTTSLQIKGDWPNPSFNGGFLPVSQDINQKGFEARWSVPFIARGVPSAGDSEIMGRLGHSALGVSFLEPADPYQSVTRSVKYALLFIGLVFLSYFLFEVASGKRVHPAQYVLIGVAQVIFYLLLLSLAERVGFDIAFGIAAVATVGLISAYAGWIFGSRTYGFRALVAFALLYALIYLLLRLEDEALLIGALASFAVIAAVMYFTRHMDWYASSTPLVAADPEREKGAPQDSRV